MTSLRASAVLIMAWIVQSTATLAFKTRRTGFLKVIRIPGGDEKKFGCSWQQTLSSVITSNEKLDLEFEKQKHRMRSILTDFMTIEREQQEDIGYKS